MNEIYRFSLEESIHMAWAETVEARRRIEREIDDLSKDELRELHEEAPVALLIVEDLEHLEARFAKALVQVKELKDDC